MPLDRAKPKNRAQWPLDAAGRYQSPGTTDKVRQGQAPRSLKPVLLMWWINIGAQCSKHAKGPDHKETGLPAETLMRVRLHKCTIDFRKKNDRSI